VSVFWEPKWLWIWEPEWWLLLWFWFWRMKNTIPYSIVSLFSYFFDYSIRNSFRDYCFILFIESPFINRENAPSCFLFME